MLEYIINTINSLGYFGIALLMALENIIPPIPSELIMPLAGFTVTQGEMNFFLVVIAGTIGSVIGATPWYFLGKSWGLKRSKKSPIAMENGLLSRVRMSKKLKTGLTVEVMLLLV